MPIRLISSRCAILAAFRMVAWRHTTLWLVLAAVLTAGCVRVSATDRARSLVRQHQEQQAAQVLRDRLKAHPEDLAARALLIRVLGATGDMVEARAQVADLQRRVPPD